MKTITLLTAALANLLHAEGSPLPFAPSLVPQGPPTAAPRPFPKEPATSLDNGPQEPRTPRPPMVLPLDYSTPQPSKEPAAAAQPATAAVAPMLPLTGMPRLTTTRIPDASHASFDQPTPTGPLWAAGADWKASFDAAGFEVHPFLGSDAPTNYPVRFRLTKATVAGSELEIANAAPTHDDHRVTWRRGGLTEYVDIAGTSLEQSFRFDRLPARGELVLELGLQTALAAGAVADGATFRNERGGLDYTKAVAIDARGERLPLAIEVLAGKLVMRVAAAFVEHAVLPLVVDPVIVAQNLTPGSVWEGASDLAWDESTQQWLVVWSRQFTLTDMDVYAQRLDANMNGIGTEFALDYTSDYWFAPRVANLNAANNYLAVCEVSVDGTSTENWWIAGRTIGAGTGGSLSFQFAIERDGVVGLSGRDFLPAIGADPAPTGPSYYTVVWTHETTPTNNDIHMKQIDGTGALRSTMPTVIDGSPNNETHANISKSDGDPGTTQAWFVAYQRTFSSVDEDIRGALVTWDGQLQQVGFQFNFAIDYSGQSDLWPNPSSPTDRSLATNQRYSLVGYTRFPCTACSGGFGVLALVDSTGTTLSWNTMQSLFAQLNVPTRPSSLDSDGARFVVAGGVTDVFFGNADNFITTLVCNPVAGTIAANEFAWISTSTVHHEYGPSIASTHSSSVATSRRYGMTYAYTTIAPGNLNIAVGLYDSPVADECGAAQPLALGINGPFTTIGSTTSAPPWGCAFNTSWDVWFSFTANATTPVTFLTCSPTTTFDTVLEVFSGSCGSLTSLGCNDDFCGYSSRVSINATTGATYYLRVGGFNGAYGDFSVDVQQGTGLGSIVRNVHGCGPTTIQTTGQPHIGGSVTTTLGNVTGFPLIGFGQTVAAVPFCGCTIGHEWMVSFVANSFVVNVPLAPSLIGVVLGVQGADFLGAGGCPSPQLTLTDTMVITIG